MKLTERRINSQNHMKEQTFGVEVEMNNITRARAAEIAADYFGTNLHSYTGYDDGYQTYSAYDAQGRKWKFSRDVSISGPEAEKCELVTPILHYEDIETLQELIRRLRKAGAKSDATRGCGIHIHVGADGHTPHSIKNLTNMMASHEQMLIRALNLDEYRISRYCRTVEPHFLELINAKTPKTMEGLADMWYTANHANYGRSDHYNDSRYHMLNLHATFTKGTIEFRLFQFDTPTLGRDGKYHGGMHAGQLKAYIQLCLAMSNRAKEMPRVNPNVTENQQKNTLQNMNAWMNRLVLIGEEFSTARLIFTRAFRRHNRRAGEVA